MVEWLGAVQAAAMVNAQVGTDDADWLAAHAGSVAYVERVRKDLFVGTPPVFTPDNDVLYGTALLVNRAYTRRTSPLGTSQNVEFGGSDFLRNDPDIARFLGIGSESEKPVFGGARAAEVDALLVVEP